jgi:catechol 2,3-dioxygenase-like lactoylglutathione lyase family enzyme
MSLLTRVAPELPARSLAESLDYYTTKMGFEVAMEMPDRQYAIVERDQIALHLFQDSSVSPTSIHIFVSGLDELLEEFEHRGAQVEQRIIRQAWGNRDFRIKDPAGNLIKFTEPLCDAG